MSLSLLPRLTLLLSLLIPPAFAQSPPNQPPQITSPTQDSYTVTEGDPLVIPFTVQEPDNDVVEYSVEYLVGGQVQSSLPQGALLATDPQTAERSFVWWPGLDQAGTYDFRFKAVDDKGASAEKMVTVAVADRSGTPAIMELKDYNGRVLFAPGDTIRAMQDVTHWVMFRVRDPEGETITVTASGLPPAATVQKDNSSIDGYVLSWRPTRADVGLHDVSLTATDLGGQSLTVSFRMDARRVWGGTSELYVIPKVTAGASNSQTFYVPLYVVSGNVSFSEEIRDFSGALDGNLIPAPAGLELQYILETPQGQLPISGILKGDLTATWDSKAIPDGTYALTVRILDSSTDFDRLHSQPIHLIVDNTPGPVTGQQLIPTESISGTRGRWHDSSQVDWLTVDGTPPHAKVTPFVYTPEPVPSSDARRQALLDPKQWFAIPLTGPHLMRYMTPTRLYQTKGGAFFVDRRAPDGGPSNRYVGLDGGRNDNNVGEFSALIPIPGSDPRIMGLDETGRLYVVGMDGSVTTVAGRKTLRDVMPYHMLDKSISDAELFAHQQVWVGTFANNRYFNKPMDIAFDPDYGRGLGREFIYVADSGNHRIAQVDLGDWSNPVITTFAGGVKGYQDGALAAAKFNEPYSIAIDPSSRIMYIADYMNSAVRTISPDGTVGTLVGKGPNAPAVPDTNTLHLEIYANLIDKWVPARAGFDAAPIPYPFEIRFDSKGNLVLAENHTDYFVRIDLARREVVRIGKVLEGALGLPLRFAVDTKGNIGPVDDILYGQIPDARAPMRLSADGLRVGTAFNMPNLYNSLPDAADTVGTGGTSGYAQGMVIDDETGWVFFTGLVRETITAVRPIHSDDPVTRQDPAAYLRGFYIYTTGIVANFPLGSRPGFYNMHSSRSFNGLGLSNFDDLAKLSDPEIARYIQAGMGGSVPRPEITGRDVRDAVYYFRSESLQGGLETIDLKAIEQNLKDTGLYTDDTRSPEIRSLQTFTKNNEARFVFKTDEPTICLVKYGPTDYYGLASRIESGYAKDHDLTINTQLSKTIIDTNHFSLLCKDQAGNLTSTPDKLMNGSDVPPPPPTNRGPNITLTPNQITFQVRVGEQLSFQATATDPEGDAVTSFLIQNLPSGATFQ